MERIETAEFDAHERRQRRIAARYGYRVPSEDDEEQERRPVLAGLATAYLKPHLYKGQIEMLDRGCFAKSLASGKRIDLQLNHDAATVAASTANGLELEESELGLLFRIDLRHVKNAAILSRMVDVGSHACASVAYSVVSDRTEKFGGHPVRIITEAALKEVSLVPRGAIKQAFAFLSDTVNTPTIVGMERSAVFALDQATHNMRRANAAILENTAQLTERVDRLCEQAGIGPTSNSSMSSEANDVLAGLDRVVKGLDNLRAA